MPKANQPMKVQQDQVRAFSQHAVDAGDIVSVDQHVVNTPGRLLFSYGREVPHNQFHGGTVFHDAATVLIWAKNQVSLELMKL